MLDRFTKGDRISLVGAVVLFIGLFLPWYGIESDIFGEGPAADLARQIVDSVSVNAFEAFDVIDIVLLLLAIGAAVLIVLVATDKVDAALHRWVETIGGAAAIAVLFRIVIQPDGASLKWGIFVALLGAVAIAAGQYLTRTGKI
jgi:hypothetical protein